jgi:hypothetical protein
VQRLESAGITDASISELPFDAWQADASDYGQQAVDTARQRVAAWLDTHIWPSHVAQTYDNNLMPA